MESDLFLIKSYIPNNIFKLYFTNIPWYDILKYDYCNFEQKNEGLHFEV